MLLAGGALYTVDQELDQGEYGGQKSESAKDITAIECNKGGDGVFRIHVTSRCVCGWVWMGVCVCACECGWMGICVCECGWLGICVCEFGWLGVCVCECGWLGVCVSAGGWV
jgi:hypothetical protein